MGDRSWVLGIPSWYLTKPPRPTQPCHPSMGRQIRVIAMVTATPGEENGEFCAAVGPVTRTVGILT